MQDKHIESGARPEITRHEYWAEHIRAWQRSGLSKAEYCRQNQITKHAFHYWFKKLQEPAQGSVVPLDLRIGDLAPSQPQFVLNIGQRFQVAIQGDFYPPVLQKLIKTLEDMS